MENVLDALNEGSKNQKFNVLTVCTGNICRSPLAEQLLRAKLASIPNIDFESAGTMAVVGAPMDSTSMRYAKRYGVFGAEAHVAASLTTASMHKADLVLGLAREHRRAALQLLPRASRITFTLREFARLSEQVPNTDLDRLNAESAAIGASTMLRRAVDLASSKRGMTPLTDAGDDDVTDPFRREEQVYEESSAQVARAVDMIVSYFRRVVING